MKNNRNENGGSFLTLLFFIFLILKLTGVIDWSWWWVTAPLWGIPFFVLGLIIILFLINLLP